jgi:hydrogenase maturation factor
MLVEPEAARHPALDLLFDPQTSGGLLIAVAPERAPALLAALREAGDGHATVVGEVAPPRPDGALIRVVATVQAPPSPRPPPSQEGDGAG